MDARPLRVDLIDVADQPRKSFDESKLAELAASIKRHGILQPLIVRPAAGDLYQLVAGERRLRAAKLAGLSEVPAIIRDTVDDQMLVAQLIENCQREDLAPLETANALYELKTREKVSPGKISELLGKSKSWVSRHLKLLELPASWRSAMEAPSRGQPVASEGAISDISRLQLLDVVATAPVRPADAVSSWSELYGRSALWGAVDNPPRRTRAACRWFADRVLAWLAWAAVQQPPPDETLHYHVVGMNVTPAWGDWRQAAMLWDDLRPDLSRLSDAQRRDLAAVAARVDFDADPFDPSEHELLTAA